MGLSEVLKNNLETLGFRVEKSKTSPVIFISELKNKNNDLSAFQIIELEKASYFKADAVFFRYFEDDRSPISQVYIYDNSDNKLNIEYAQIHKELWSNCHIATFIIVEKTKIKIFDCRKPVSINLTGEISTKEIALIDINNIENYSNVIEKYNAEKFSNGSFWESEEAHKHYLYGKTAYKDLIDKLKLLRKDYNKNIKMKIIIYR